MKQASRNIAIITRTKNRLTLLGRALESVDKQTYTDYIHVIINDGGDKKALEDFLKNYPSEKRRVIHNEKSEGMFRASNIAVRSVESKYITLLDDDDSWAPERLQIAAQYIEDHKDKQVVVVKMDLIIEEILPDNTVKLIEQQLHPESGDGEISLYKQCFKNYLSDGAIMYSRKVYNELGGYDESLTTAGDWDFGIRLLQKYDVPLIHDGPSLVLYHQRPEQAGVLGNALHAGARRQEETINLIRNKYLREDLRKGVFGVGYIMNNIPAEVQNVVRLEAHVNRSVAELEQKLAKKSDLSLFKMLANDINKLLGRIKKSL